MVPSADPAKSGNSSNGETTPLWSTTNNNDRFRKRSRVEEVSLTVRRGNRSEMLLI